LILQAAKDFVLNFLADDEVEPPGFVERARECVVLTLVPAALASATCSASPALSL
jgi:hypothetical protein